MACVAAAVAAEVELPAALTDEAKLAGLYWTETGVVGKARKQKVDTLKRHIANVTLIL